MVLKRRGQTGLSAIDQGEIAWQGVIDLLLHVQSAVKKLAEIGTGAFGEVWLGHNSTFGKVAVKTIKVWYFSSFLGVHGPCSILLAKLGWSVSH